MKKLLFLAGLLMILFSPSQVFADNDFSIQNFNSKLIVQKNGVANVQETIVVDFPSEHHGIFRDIPYSYQGRNGKTMYTDISVQDVEMDGELEQYSTSYMGGNLEIKIGDPTITITGEHTYIIYYTVKGILQNYGTQDELYWNVTGNSWGVPISSASATVTLAKSGIEQIACYEGAFGSTNPCVSKTNTDSQAEFSSSYLNPEEGLTVAVGYTHGLFPILVGKHSWWQSSFLQEIAKGAIPVVITLVVMAYLWMKKGRDLLLRQKYLFDPHAKEDTRPLGYKDAIVVEYTPPDGLRPAEMGVLVDEKADQLDVTATVIDLATRGYLTITEIPKKWVFGSVDYTLTRKKKDTAGLLDYEKELLNRLFEIADVVSLSDLKQKFYKDLKVVEDQLDQELVDKKFFPQSPDAIRTTYFIIGTVIMVGSFLLYNFIHFSVSFTAGCVLSGLLIHIFSRFMPSRTAQGAEMLRRIKGYQLFISGAEKYKQQFFEKENMFNEILPYAIVFGLTEKFAKAMKDMGIEPTQPSWYVGSGAFNSMLFVSQLNAFSSSMSQTIASSPSSGGGFSGGGGGGGGGGGW